jgi:hypothetical protein
MAVRKPRPQSPSRDGLLPDEPPSIEQDVARVVAEPREWLDTPNDRLGGLKPKELIGTNREPLLHDLLRAIKQGMPT